MGKTAGILALQGDFEAHANAVQRAGGNPRLVRSAKDFDCIDGLILPGGESTTMLKLLHREQMFQPLREFAAEKPLFGTCAGLILMARRVTGPEQESLGILDVAVERNAYGRQIDSRVVKIDPEPGAPFDNAGAEAQDMEAVFIRAPIIRSAAPGVKVLARYAGDPVLVQQGAHLASSFHPELTDQLRVHRLFLESL